VIEKLYQAAPHGSPRISAERHKPVKRFRLEGTCRFRPGLRQHTFSLRKSAVEHKVSDRHPDVAFSISRSAKDPIRKVLDGEVRIDCDLDE
jgi:hypothetical protein